MPMVSSTDAVKQASAWKQYMNIVKAICANGKKTDVLYLNITYRFRTKSRMEDIE